MAEQDKTQKREALSAFQEFNTAADTSIPAWAKESAQILDELARLTLDWDEGRAEPPNVTAIELARLVLKELRMMRFPPQRIAPCVDEGVTFSFLLKEKELVAIEVYNSGEIMAILVDGRDTPQIWEVERESGAIRAALEQLKAFVDQR